MTHTSLVVAGRYRLEGRIAVGGVGEVWRAVDLVLNRPVAVKLLRPEFAQHPETLARFRAEARHAAAVAHPAIAQVYDYGEAGSDVPYLVLELVPGPSLAGLLTAGPLDPGTTMDVLAQAAAGLQAAHEAGLVHRDIKPGNLLVGPGGEVKITDFGIAYAAGSAPITRTGMLVGTPAYLAPERAAGGPATPASDLYSLGVVGYACLTGAPPFSGVPVEVAAAHRLRDLPPLPPTVPAGVAGLVGELTAKDPAARPASAGDVAQRAGRLRDALAGGATAVLPSEPTAVLASEPATLAGAPAPSRPPSRSPGVLLAVAGAVLMAALGLWLLASSFGGAPPQHHPRAAHAAARTGGASVVRTVGVNAAAMTGQPAGLVLHRLREAGLDPRVVRAVDGGLDPGTVISVHPNGQIPAGSAVTVTVALPPPGHRQGDGHGHGHGDHGGNGQGDNNGGD